MSRTNVSISPQNIIASVDEVNLKVEGRRMDISFIPGARWDRLSMQPRPQSPPNL